MTENKIGSFRFEPTINLGNVIQITFFGILLVVAWVSLGDRVSNLETAKAADEKVIQQELEVMQGMQMSQVQQTDSLTELQRRLNIVEQIDGLDGTAKRK